MRQALHPQLRVIATTVSAGFLTKQRFEPSFYTMGQSRLREVKGNLAQVTDVKTGRWGCNMDADLEKSFFLKL